MRSPMEMIEMIETHVRILQTSGVHDDETLGILRRHGRSHFHDLRHPFCCFGGGRSGGA